MGNKYCGFAVAIVNMGEVSLRRIDTPDRNSIKDGQRSLIRYCAENDIPVIGIESPETSGPMVVGLRSEILGTPRNLFVDCQNGGEGFYKTILERQLRDWDVHTLGIGGIHASYGVRAFATGARGNGFNFLISRDIVADPEDAPTQETFGWFSEEGAVFRTHNDLLYTFW